MPDSSEHVNVLIVGAGLSGIGAAVHLQQSCPGKSYAILESREAMGGTWDLFRYPGIRSDSDMFTLGYSFKPWLGENSITDGESILDYIKETAREYGVEGKIRFGHKVVAAEWSSADARWTVRAESDGQPVEITCDWLYGCTGYYRYDEGFSPNFEGTERFAGEIVHPQHWPEDLDYAGKRVLVIGSGATAMTLVPAMAERAAHVTMLQRSPTYVIARPARDALAHLLRRLLPEKAAYTATRWKNVFLMLASYKISRRWPQVIKRIIRKEAQAKLPEGYDVDTHFKPRYNPWDERLCVVPDADLFKAIGSGKAEVVTDHVETFTEKGVRLQSGRELEADVIVTATGLNLLVFGGLQLLIDGKEKQLSETVGYKGMMFSGVPNMCMAMGYTNASFTLKTDLVADYVCRLIKHMDADGYRVATPKAPGPDIETEPFIDLKSGYVLRSLDQLPKQAAAHPWRLHQNYAQDIRLLRKGPIDDEIEFSQGGTAKQPSEQTGDFAAVA
ncbi:MAG TPA: NAD(P)/FAD-dependent oxidoreductase [Solirubrobacterales bacterium]|nr:NAD(P)/FAD-dependent oxidoreductase [Solirubrobacterales bacterium]